MISLIPLIVIGRFNDLNNFANCDWMVQVLTVQQLKAVEEQELEDIRMKKDDIAKLKKSLKKEFPQSTFGKLRKVGHLLTHVAFVVFVFS